MSLGLVLPSQGGAHFCGTTTTCVGHVDFDPRPRPYHLYVDMVHYLCQLWGDIIGLSVVSKHRRQVPMTRYRVENGTTLYLCT